MSSIVQAGPPEAPSGFVARWVQNVRESGRNPRKTLAGFCLAWIAFFLILHVMPEPQGLSPAGQATLAIMVWACIMWVLDAIPVGVSGLLIPMMLVITNAVKPMPVAAHGFVAPVIFLVLGAFIFAAIMQAAGLDRRLALWLLHRFKATTTNGVIWSVFGVNLVLCLAIPAAVARAATLLPVINGITSLFGESEREQAAKKAIVIQSLVYGSMISGMCILTAHLPNAIIVGLAAQHGYQISFLQWFELQWPYLFMFAITQWWVQFYFKNKGVTVKGGAPAIEQQYRTLPRMGQTDWLILAGLGFVALLWILEKKTGIASQNAALIGLAILFVPGLFQFKWKEIQDRTMWGTVLLLAGALSLSFAMGKTGRADWFADLLRPFLIGQPWWIAALILMGGTHVMRLGMLSNVASIAMIAPILMAMAPMLGFHPVTFTMLIADTDSFAYILPTQITAAVIAYASGTFSINDYAKVGVVSVLIAIAYGVVVMAHWYAFMGVPVWNPHAWPF